MLLKEGFHDFQEKPVEVSSLEKLLLRTLPEEKIVYKDDMKESQEPEKQSVLKAAVNARERLPKASEAVTELSMQEQEKGAIHSEYTGSSMEAFAVGDLDVELGMTYCGGRELYLAILQEYAQKKEENWRLIEELFEAKDWKNYVIAVHAIKSSMLTIGAENLSNMAKRLELEGKAGNFTYIECNHEMMVAEFKRVIGEIVDSPYVLVEDGPGEVVNKPMLSTEAANDRFVAFEEAVYGLEESRMLTIIEELSGFAYGAYDLEKELKPVKHKVSMCDYMSALEALRKVLAKCVDEG